VAVIGTDGSRTHCVPSGANADLLFERLLNDIRVIAFDSSRSYSDPTWANSKTVAEDLVDLVMCGTIYQMLHDFAVLDDFGRIRDRYYWQLRQEFHAGRRKRRSRQRDPSGAG
jgi:hypothetical protein